jgi:hypothetical protein
MSGNVDSFFGKFGQKEFYKTVNIVICAIDGQTKTFPSANLLEMDTSIDWKLGIRREFVSK